MIRRPAAAPPTGYRPHMPLKVKLAACERQLFGPNAKIDYDHNPPLQQRVWDSEKNDTVPAANDPAYITPLLREEHRAKTGKRKGKATTRGQDVPEIRKTQRLANAQEALATALEGKKCGEPINSKKLNSNWPKGRKIQGRNTLRKKKT